MSEIKIKCPTCGKILRLNGMPNINSASFTCPNCKEKHIVGNCQRYDSVPNPGAQAGDETRYGNASSDQQSGDDETRYAGNGTGQSSSDGTRTADSPQSKIGFLVDANGTSYKLCIGVNTIGRKALSSPASVQIATDDRTMSRNHVVIEVRNAGWQLLHILKNGENKNPSYHNNVLVEQNDQLILNDGDTIKMGCTILTFKK